MTMELTGRSLVGGKRSDASAGTFNAINPATGATLEPAYHAAPPSEVSRACDLAGDAFGSYRQTSVALRAAFLHDIASGIEAIGDALIDR
ncbi:MAG TPA: aldehyde dehydrogenase family protein, partial [Tepidisphaeraceae bacterium]|nr:aldehyde dehydrogenase family protein [Tepidisphaeraceae bacterium]